MNTPRYGLQYLIDRRIDGVDDFFANCGDRRLEHYIASNVVYENPSYAIVAGDFNITEQSVLYRNHWNHLQNVFDVAGRGFGNICILNWYGVRIDHILVGSEIKVSASKVIDFKSGDHNLVYSKIALSKCNS